MGMAISLTHPWVWLARQQGLGGFLWTSVLEDERCKRKCAKNSACGYKTPTENGRRSWQWCSVSPDSDQWWVSIVVQSTRCLPIAAVLVTSVPRTSPNCSGSPLKLSYLEKCGWEWSHSAHAVLNSFCYQKGNTMKCEEIQSTNAERRFQFSVDLKGL